MGQGLFRMVEMSFFLSSTCSRIRARSSSVRDSPPEALEAKEGDLEGSQGGAQESGKEVSMESEEPIARQTGYRPDTQGSDSPSQAATPPPARRGHSSVLQLKALGGMPPQILPPESSPPRTTLWYSAAR